MLVTNASGFDGSGAIVERADPFGIAMLTAHPSRLRNGGAAFHRAHRCLAVVFPTLSSHSDGVVHARFRGAASIGAVLDADKLAKDLRGLAVWIGAGQLRRVLFA